MNPSLSKQTHLPGYQAYKGSKANRSNGERALHPYMRPEFWANPRNQFWNSSLYSEKSKEYFNKRLTN